MDEKVNVSEKYWVLFIALRFHHKIRLFDVKAINLILKKDFKGLQSENIKLTEFRDRKRKVD